MLSAVLVPPPQLMPGVLQCCEGGGPRSNRLREWTQAFINKSQKMINRRCPQLQNGGQQVTGETKEVHGGWRLELAWNKRCPRWLAAGGRRRARGRQGSEAPSWQWEQKAGSGQDSLLVPKCYQEARTLATGSTDETELSGTGVESELASYGAGD